MAALQVVHCGEAARHGDVCCVLLDGVLLALLSRIGKFGSGFREEGKGKLKVNFRESEVKVRISVKTR